MMARLLEAVRPDARLVLVGDPDQLSSVEAGAVLTDLVRGFQGRADSPVAALQSTHRFGAEIGALAEALRAGDADDALEVLAPGTTRWSGSTRTTLRRAIRSTALPRPSPSVTRPSAVTSTGALAALDRHRLLCAHRDGPYGVRHWNRRIEHWLTAETGDPLHERAYVGRPLLVTANDYRSASTTATPGWSCVAPAGPRAVIAASAARATSRPPARRRRDDARDDHPQVPGQPGRRGHRAAARRGLPAADARALLHRGHPCALQVRVVVRRRRCGPPSGVGRSAPAGSPYASRRPRGGTPTPFHRRASETPTTQIPDSLLACPT